MAENRIAFFRRESGMNQKELGQQLGVAQTTVSAWERGINEPDNESMHKMAKLFHTTIGYLSGYEPESFKRGLSDKEFELYQRGIMERISQQDMERLIEQNEQLEEERENDFTKEQLEELYLMEDYENWQAGVRAQTIEGYRAGTLIDMEEPNRRKWLLETLKQLIKAPK